MRRNILWFFFIACLLGALLLATFGVLRVIEARSSTSWPTVTGTIVESSFRRSGTENRRELRVRYTYTVDGTAYENERIAFGGKPASESNRGDERTLDILSFGLRPTGSTTPVYYDPDNPQNAVLVPGGGFFIFYYVFAAAFLLAVSRALYWALTGRFDKPKVSTSNEG